MRVVLLGHSQVPREDVNLDDFTLECVRCGGAYIKDFYRNPIREYVESNPDVIFCWIGGNDLAKHDADEVTEQLLNLVDYLAQHTSNIYLLNIEDRKYPGEEYTKYYMHQANLVNRRLKQLAKRRRTFRTVNVAGQDMAGDSDDIHFGVNGLRWVYNKIRLAVNYAIRDGTVNL